MTKRFYKQNNLWYVDLPDYIEAGLGSYNNLLMVDGSDEFLDILSNHGNAISLKLETTLFETAQYTLVSERLGMNLGVLDRVGHAQVDYGMYYQIPELSNHRMWLCPVTEYVFEGAYPDKIWVEVVNN